MKPVLGKLSVVSNLSNYKKNKTLKTFMNQAKKIIKNP